VRVLHLSDVISDHDIISPALLKIDVQGYEKQVLQGCEPPLQNFDWIFVELSFVELYKGQALAPSILAWLAERGFLYLAFIRTLSHSMRVAWYRLISHSVALPALIN
jgi:hypothetical protein